MENLEKPTSRRTVEDLRDQLFATIDGLRDGSLDVARARAITDVAQVIVNSAKVEAEVMKATRHKGSGFLPELAAPAETTKPGQPRLVSPKGMGNG